MSSAARRTGLYEDGGPVTLLGPPLAPGERARDFRCVRQDPETYELLTMTLADTPALPRLFSVIPSIDTPVCAAQTRRFGDEAEELVGQTAIYAVSIDTPYALNRGLARTPSIVALSDYRPERSFGNAWGVLVEETGELARAVFVADAGGVVRHAEQVANADLHPDYDAALAALRGCL